MDDPRLVLLRAVSVGILSKSSVSRTRSRSIKLPKHYFLQINISKTNHMAIEIVFKLRCRPELDPLSSFAEHQEIVFLPFGASTHLHFELLLNLVTPA